MLYCLLLLLYYLTFIGGWIVLSKAHEPPPDFQDQRQDIIHVQNREEYIEPTITLYNHYTKTLEDMPRRNVVG